MNKLESLTKNNTANTIFELLNTIFFLSNKKKEKANLSNLRLTIGTSVIFTNPQKEVLLLLRDDIPIIRYPGCWDILGGNLDEGETPKECIVREMKEEIEFKLKAPKLLNVYIKYDRIEYTFWKQVDFKVNDINLHEGQKIQWFTQEEIINMPEYKIAFDFKHVLLDFFEKEYH